MFQTCDNDKERIVNANLVVVTFKDKSVLKGTTSDFLPNKETFHLEEENGNISMISTEQLKAIFFVKDLTGNKNYNEEYIDAVPGGGKKLRVKFLDGEVIVGYTQGYSKDRPGFFVVPGDKGSNNLRIFVIRSATESIEME